MKIRYCEKKMIEFFDLECDCMEWHYNEFGEIVCEVNGNYGGECWPGVPGCPLVCEVLGMDPEIVIVDKEVINEN